MKKIIISAKFKAGAAGLSLAIFLFVFWCLNERLSPEAPKVAPVEPFLIGLQEDLSKVPHIQPGYMVIYDISADSQGNNIIYGSDNKATLLDREGKLKWERTLESAPLQTVISKCGSYIAIGTSGGRLLFLTEKQEVLWEKYFEKPVNNLAITGNTLVAGCGSEGDFAHNLYFFDLKGNERWEAETGVLKYVEIYSLLTEDMEIEMERIGLEEKENVLSFEESAGVTRVVSRDFNGEILWTIDNASKGYVSQRNRILAVYKEGSLGIYNLAKGEELWKEKLEIEPSLILINPVNNRVLVYNEFSGGADNLYYFSSSGLLLWKRRIDDGSLVAFSLKGRSIISSSWRQYKDNTSKFLILTQGGEELNSFDVTVQVEKMFTIDENTLFLAGKDGRIYKVNPSAFHEDMATRAQIPYYVPVMWGDEVKDKTMVSLYFYDRHANYLIPVSRAIKESWLSLAIEELIRGPLRGSELLRTIPKDSQVLANFNAGNRAVYLDLDPQLSKISGSTQSLGVINSLLLTTSHFPGVESIYFTVDGQRAEIFGEGIALDYPTQNPLLERRNMPVIIPYRSGERFYLLPLFQMEEEFTDLKNLLQWVIKRCPAFFPANTEIQNIVTYEDTTRIFLNQAFTSMFPVNGGERERARTAAALDALFLTVAENVGTEKIYLIVDGKPWSPPQGYPTLFREIKRPYYINPER